MKLKVFIFSIIFIFSIFAGIGFTQNRVVVIPLIDEGPPLEPFAPLADESPPSSSYSLGTNYIIDNVTGLFWQQLDDNTPRDWKEAWAYCRGLNIGGWGDWRLPSVDELMSIVDYEEVGPAINPFVFPDTDADSYWSATTYIGDGTLWVGCGSAWIVHFNQGIVNNADKSNTTLARCVRGLPPQDIFKDNGDGTVTDLATGLMWQGQDDHNSREWADADTYCQGLNLGNKGDWRLPNIKELRSIVDNRRSRPATDNNAFPGAFYSTYWSATTYADESGRAWEVDFYYGKVFNLDKTTTGLVRCVR